MQTNTCTCSTATSTTALWQSSRSRTWIDDVSGCSESSAADSACSPGKTCGLLLLGKCTNCRLCWEQRASYYTGLLRLLIRKKQSDRSVWSAGQASCCRQCSWTFCQLSDYILIMLTGRCQACYSNTMHTNTDHTTTTCNPS